MLDSILGLPLHPLLVHLPVVMLPLSALAVIALVLKPSWRSRFTWPVLGMIVLGVVGAWGAKLSGSGLAEIVGLPVAHANLGDATAITALVFLGVAGGWLLWVRRAEQPSGLQQAGGLVAVAVGAAVTVLTVLTGHAGATSVWEDRLAPAPTVSGTEAPTYTLEDVKSHASASDCWVVINANVYDLTEWVPQHPGGADEIEPWCGSDASAAFGGEHGDENVALATLPRFLLGPLA